MVVLSNNDGCAVARSAEIKALGVKMGTPWFQIQDLAKQHGITAYSSNIFAVVKNIQSRKLACSQHHTIAIHRLSNLIGIVFEDNLVAFLIKGLT